MSPFDQHTFKEPIIRFNNLSKADGSALVDQDNNIVQVAVFGPVDISQSKVNQDEATVEVVFKPKRSVQSNSDEFEHILEVENLLRCIFKEIIHVRLHPRTLISIMVQEIQDSGSLISAAINATCYALLDAGLPMKCPIAAISLESQECKFDFVFDTKMDLITTMTRGCTNMENLNKAIEEGQFRAKRILELVRNKIKERFV